MLKPAVHMTPYETYGPFNLERTGAKLSENSLSDFWSARSTDSDPNLCDAVGIYIIAVQAKKTASAKPWYVGKTDKQSFKKRFDQHELLFRKVLEEAKKGQLQVYLIALRTPSNKKFRKATNQDVLKHNVWLESMLIGSAYALNPKLLNASKTRYLKTMCVPGYINNRQGKLHSAASSLKDLLHVQ